ncbi:MAG: hypothetical protein AAB116_09130 [Candidatus Poribacteria bacterium]
MLPAILWLCAVFFSRIGQKLIIKKEYCPHRREIKSVVLHDSIGRKLNTRFFLVASTSVLFVSLALSVAPSVVVFRRNSKDDVALAALIAILTSSIIMLLGLIHSLKKGDMDWQDGKTKRE